MGRRGVAIVVPLIAAAGAFWLFRTADPESLRSAPAAVAASAPAPAGPAPALETPAKAAPPELSPEIQDEVRRAGQIDPDPLASERRLDRLAQALKTEEILSLSEFVRDFAADGDQRAVGVELLARSPSDAALGALEQIALSPVPKLGEPRREGFERALRARALEGLGSHPNRAADRALRHVADSTDDAFLSDRARRALASRSGQAPDPARQDDEALKKLLE